MIFDVKQLRDEDASEEKGGGLLPPPGEKR
jgi:hypothetical protein